MGVIEIDPVQLLEDGLRSGIARRISAALVTHSQASNLTINAHLPGRHAGQTD
jgi:hypothetical protein